MNSSVSFKLLTRLNDIKNKLGVLIFRGVELGVDMLQPASTNILASMTKSSSALMAGTNGEILWNNKVQCFPVMHSYFQRN